MSTRAELDALARDLTDEQASLDGLVASIDESAWHRDTPAVGWTVLDQIAHLAYFDDAATVAILEPDTFRASLDAVADVALAGELDEYTLGPWRAMDPTTVLSRWRANRAGLAVAATTLDPATRVPWYGPSMSAASFLTARLMETWAHGTDVADALGARLVASDRLVHVARLGVITRAWSYAVRGEPMPEGRVRVALTSPSGNRWVWGDEDAEDVVSGPAEDFCLVVTQRRHLDDTALVTGELARHWLIRAQAFAGGATLGPKPKERP